MFFVQVEARNVLLLWSWYSEARSPCSPFGSIHHFFAFSAAADAAAYMFKAKGERPRERLSSSRRVPSLH